MNFYIFDLLQSMNTILYCRMHTSEAVRSARPSNISTEKYIFNRQAYKLQGSEWIKLQRMLIDTHLDNKNTKSISKVKIKGSKGYENTFQVKITFNGKDLFYSMTQELQLQWFVHVINTKIEQSGKGTPQIAEYVNVCSGKVFKKTFLGEWEECFVMITQAGLTVCKEDDNSKVQVEIESVKEIWTRFEMVEIQKRPNFVFKLRSFFKYEFAVPIDTVNKWCKAFYSLICFA